MLRRTLEALSTLRRDASIVVVSGLPRSGTSMAMRMLDAGGMPLLTDGARRPDDDNPLGYYEFERVKGLEGGRDVAWLADARGRAVKVISYLLLHLPQGYSYKIVFMHRDLGEILASQHRMLERRGQRTSSAEDGLREAFEQHLSGVREMIGRRADFEVLDVSYAAVIGEPPVEASRLNRFLGGRLDEAGMAGAVEPTLYRNRAGRQAAAPDARGT